MKAIVVGAGFGGLATAALLSSKGMEVAVVERNEIPGGRAGVFEQDGFRFDMGPSWYLMPEVFEHYFSLLGEERSSFYGLKKLEPSFRVSFRDEFLDIDTQNILDVAGRYGEGPDFKRYLSACGNLYRKVVEKLLYRDFIGLASMLNPSVIWALPGSHITWSMDRFASKFIESRKLRQILGFPAVFLGGDPYSIPAIYSMINHSIFSDGVYYPEGGFGKVVKSLVRLCQEGGVKFHFSETVNGVEIDGNKIRGVLTEKGTYRGDIFIFNGDYAYMEKNIIPERLRSHGDRYWESRDYSPSALLYYLGLKKNREVRHHTVYISENWETQFLYIKENRNSIPEDFSFYICSRSSDDPSSAPENHDSLFVLVPVPMNYSEPDDDLILSRIFETPGIDLDVGSVVLKRRFLPSDFKRRYLGINSSAFGLSQTLRQTAGMRPSIRSRKIRNLFYVGQNTHPGIGVPMAFISASVVSRAVLKSSGMEAFPGEKHVSINGIGAAIENKQ